MKATITANKKFVIDQLDRRIYGSFLEHFGRAVYDGIYEPSHPDADELGFRRDVIELVKKLNVPIVRYPGGNFVSGYHWEDGIGDKSKRPRRMGLAWQVTETNEVGLDDFQEWAKRADTEVMMTVNLGTGDAEEAAACVEYCNATTDTHYAKLRRANGFEQPFGIKVWCLGNEPDGSWQIGHKTADEYGKLAVETAKLMKWVDPSIELVVSGSSYHGMPTFGEWELAVLEHAYDYVDYIAIHQYYGNREQDTPKFLAKSESMDTYIKGVVAICDAVKAKKRSDKTLHISFDEWNICYRSEAPNQRAEKWTQAPKLMEEIYTFEDALVLGCLLMTLQNNCDRVKMACLAQLVNAIAPIMTEHGGKAWLQTTFYPYLLASLYGNGTVLRAVTESDSYVVEKTRKIPYLTASVIYNAETEEIVVFAANRSLEESMELTVELQGFGNYEPIEQVELYADDLNATNDCNHQRVSPTTIKLSPNNTPILKKHSWNMIRYKIST